MLERCTAQSFARSFVRLSIVGTILLGCLILGTTQTASAQDGLREESSLRFVPADADFYYSSSHHADQVSALLGSRAAALAAELFAKAQELELGDEGFGEPDFGERDFGEPDFGEPEFKESSEEAVPPAFRESRVLQKRNDAFVAFGADDPFGEPSEVTDDFGGIDDSDAPLEPGIDFDFEEEPPVWEGIMQSFQEWASDPENRELAPLLLDAASNEVFIYSTGYSELISLQQEGYQNMAKELLAYAKKHPGATLDNDFMEELDWDKIVPWDKLETAKMMDLVIGVKVSNPDKVAFQLTRLHKLIEDGLNSDDDLKMFAERFSAGRIGRHPFLTMKLDGDMIPWGEADLTELTGKQRVMAERAIAIMKKKTITAAIGVWEDYLIVSIGDNNDHLANLGEGDLLIDRKEFAKVRKHSDEKVVSVWYASEEFAKTASNIDGTLDYYRAMASLMLNDPSIELDGMVRGRIERDMKEFQTDLVSLIPKAGAMVRFVLWDEHGYEGYIQNWTENRHLTTTEPLTILQHTGRSPVVVMASNLQQREDLFDIGVKWVERGWLYIEDFVPPELDPEEREKFKRFATKVPPLWEKFVATTREKWQPAVANGQRAFVAVEGEAISIPLPTGEKSEPLPTIEFALITGVSDKEKFLGAATDYYDLIDETAAVLHDVDPDAIPKWTVPRPKPVKGEEDLHYYALPKEVREGVDRKELITLGVSDDVAVITSTQAVAKQILKSRPAKLGGVATGLDKPLASVTYIDVERGLKLAERWTAEAIRQGAADIVPGLIEEAFPQPDFDDFESTEEFDPTPAPFPEPEEPRFEFERESREPAFDSSLRRPSTSFVVLDDLENADPNEFQGDEAVDDPIETQLDLNRRLFQLLRCVRGYSSVTYEKHGALETHFRYDIRDVEE